MKALLFYRQQEIYHLHRLDAASFDFRSPIKAFRALFEHDCPGSRISHKMQRCLSYIEVQPCQRLAL